MYYKNRFNRPRPMRLDPSILSPIDPPGYSAFPSGHAIQSFLIAQCLEQVVPAALGTAPPAQQGPFWLLAQRIAKLREILGVHYPTDTIAGRRVALAAFPLMMRCALIAGTPGPIGSSGFPDNQPVVNSVRLQIAGQPVYDNGWFWRAWGGWVPR